MTRFRIARDTLSGLAVALTVGACSTNDGCCRPCPTAGVAAPEAPAGTNAGPCVAVVATLPPDPGADGQSPADAAVAREVHNYRRLSKRLARSAAPEGDAAFVALAAAGIKSILTVDGATPDVETAKRHGIRYVHIPFGYDGIPEATGLELAKTFEQLARSGPILVHCHHGKHRGPAASGVARIVLDGVTNDVALADMKAAGTDPRYAGLYESIRTYRKPAAETLATVKAEMPEIAPAGSRSAAMSAIDQTWERMKSVRTAKWRTPADHADVEPTHEAVILAEGLREFGRRPEIAAESDAFRKLLADAEASAWDLSKALETGGLDAGRAEAAFTATQQTCAACHAQFRDNTHR